MLRNFPVQLLSKKKIAESTVELTFLVRDPHFSFKAGQYITVEVPGLSSESVPNRYHDFSIVSSPKNPQEIAIAFRISDSIYKATILSIVPGDMVNISGPKGSVVLPRDTSTPIVLVGGGIGIAPLLSMIRDAFEKSSSQELTLLYFNKSKDSIPYQGELLAHEKRNPLLHVHFLIGAPSDAQLTPYIDSLPNAFWYVMGAPKFVSLVRQILLSHGTLDSKIRTDEFPGYNSTANII